MSHTLDATGKKIGRVASQAAAILIGKNSVTFEKNRKEAVIVTVINSSKADISEKKMKQTMYDFYSGYPGGLKQLSMEHIIQKKGFGEIIRKAVYGMLPANRLRSRLIKRLIVRE